MLSIRIYKAQEADFGCDPANHRIVTMRPLIRKRRNEWGTRQKSYFDKTYRAASALNSRPATGARNGMTDPTALTLPAFCASTLRSYLNGPRWKASSLRQKTTVPFLEPCNEVCSG